MILKKDIIRGDKRMAGKIKTSILWIMILCISFAGTVYANSSWVWLTDKKPWHLLPVAVVLTLLIEITMHKYLLNIKSVKVYVAIIIANVCSFLLPYVMVCYVNYSQVLYTVKETLNAGPTYMIRFGYLFMTLVIEVPIVRSMIKELVGEAGRKKAFSVTVISNIITTVLVFVIERMLCQGTW